MLSSTYKPKHCAHCRTLFTPQRMGQAVCSPICAVRQVKAKKVEERAQIKTRKEAIKPRGVLIAEAQDAFNAFIRARDQDQPCISCGVVNPPMTTGGQWDAGHFLSRGSHPELRFVEDNCHRQCKSCNGGGGRFKRQERTVSAAYEAELVRRIGQERVDALKGPHPAAKLSLDDFRVIRKTYQEKLKALRRERNEA